MVVCDQDAELIEAAAGKKRGQKAKVPGLTSA